MEPISSSYFLSSTSSSTLYSSSEDSAIYAEEGSSSLDREIDKVIQTMSEEATPKGLLEFRGPSISRQNSEAENVHVVVKKRYFHPDNPSENSGESISFSFLDRAKTSLSRSNSVISLVSPLFEPETKTLILKKTLSLFKKIKEKISKVKDIGRMACCDGKIFKHISITPLLEHPVDMHLTENLYIMIHTPEEELCLGYEKLKEFNLRTISLGLTQAEQEILLAFSSTQTALQEIYECNCVLEQASNKQKEVLPLLTAPLQEDLKIVRTPFLFIAVSRKAEKIQVTFECTVKSIHEPTEYLFSKSTEIYRVREEPELLVVEYSLKKI
jgi:hypothetical protein